MEGRIDGYHVLLVHRLGDKLSFWVRWPRLRRPATRTVGPEAAAVLASGDPLRPPPQPGVHYQVDRSRMGLGNEAGSLWRALANREGGPPPEVIDLARFVTNLVAVARIIAPGPPPH